MIRMKSTSTSRLPDGYQEVDYIESSSSQYIDTGVAPTKTTRVVIDMQFLEVSDASAFGIYGDSGIDNCPASFAWGYKRSSANWGIILSDTGNILNETSETYDTSRNIWDLSTDTTKINDTIVYPSGSQKITITSANNIVGALLLFGVKDMINSGKITCSESARVYSCKIYDDTTLIRDYIPCYRKSDNEVGLYDLANNEFYSNASTDSDSFIMGSIVNADDLSLKPYIGNKKVTTRYIGDNLIYGKAISPYSQKINYTMLYDNGNECSDITGGWKLSSRYTSASAKKYENYIYLHTSTASIVTSNSINLSEYIKFGGAIKDVISLHGQLRFAIGESNSATDGTSLGWDNISGNKYYELTHSYTHFVGYYTFARDTNYYLAIILSDSANDAYCNIYNTFLLKQDDWQTLCTKAELDASNYDDEVVLCADNNAIATILSNKNAVEYMIYNCTGSFMGEFIANDNCLAILNNSEYKTIIQSNEHWNKFLNMVT